MYSRFASLGPTSGAVSTTYSDTGAPSTPAVVFTFGSDNVQTPTTDDVGSSRVRTWFGASVSTSNRVNVAIKSNNGQAAGVCHTVVATDAHYDRINGGSATRQLSLDSDSFLSNGYRAIVDATGGFGANMPIFMIGGAEVTATIVSFDEPAATGTADITSSGFGTPDLVIFVLSPAHVVITAGTPISTAASVGVGAAARLSDTQGVWAGYSLNGADPSLTASYCRLGECVAGFSSAGAINAQARVTSWITDGVQITWDARAVTGRRHYAVLIKGVSASIGSFTTQTDTSTDMVVSSLGFAPKGGFCFSANKAEDSAGTATAEHKMSIGCYDYTSSTITQFAVGNWDEHNLATTSSQGASNYGENYLRLGNADALVGSANITAIGADSVTRRMTDADPDQVFAWTLDWGDTATGTGGSVAGAQTTAATGKSIATGFGATTQAAQVTAATGASTSSGSGGSSSPVQATAATGAATATGKGGSVAAVQVTAGVGIGNEGTGSGGSTAAAQTTAATGNAVATGSGGSSSAAQASAGKGTATMTGSGDSSNPAQVTAGAGAVEAVGSGGSVAAAQVTNGYNPGGQIITGGGGLARRRLPPRDY